MSMVIHCGGKMATFEEVAAIEPPEQTDSYRPVPHGDLIRLVKQEVADQYQLDKPRECYALAADGRRLFGTLSYDLVGSENKLMQKLDLSAFGIDTEAIMKQYAYSIAFRNSYDKSMGVGISGGANVMVCDNLALVGSDFAIKMHHTPGVWDRLVPELILRIRNSIEDVRHSLVLLEGMKRLTISRTQAFETIGVALGTGVLTTNQASKALAEYRSCMKDETHHFHELKDSPFALYQHFTEALKLGKDVQRKMDKYTGVSRLFEERRLVN